jgi:hypothetical protein
VTRQRLKFRLTDFVIHDGCDLLVGKMIGFESSRFVTEVGVQVRYDRLYLKQLARALATVFARSEVIVGGEKFRGRHHAPTV